MNVRLPLAQVLSTALALSACGGGDQLARDAERYRRESERAAKIASTVKLSPREKWADTRAKEIGGAGGTGERGAASRLAKRDLPFEKVWGYVVRGTDESSFKPCGSDRVYYTRVGPGVIGELVQRYRFKSPTVLTPVYFELMARLVEDTVVLGDHVYTAVAEINHVFPEVPGLQPACPRPRRGSLIGAAALARRD